MLNFVDKKKGDVSRDANWGTENAISREKGIAEEEERKTKEARNKVDSMAF